MAAKQPDDKVGKLVGEFAQGQPTGTVDKAAYDARWQPLWAQGLEPGQLFDIGQVAPQLQHLVSSGTVPVKEQRCLVPGCGRGYDVVTFAAAGGHAVGLDISPTAKQEAEAYRDATLPPDAAQRAAYVQADFFTYEDPGGQFDIGYDYTFFCALHPDMRAGWAASWARLLKPGGQLITMVYPVEAPGSPYKDGPPWPVTPQLYEQYLLPAGFECLQLEPNALAIEKRAGREYIGRWRRLGSGGEAAKM